MKQAIKTMSVVSTIVGLGLVYWYARSEKRVSGDRVLSDVRENFKQLGKVTGSWINLTPVRLDEKPEYPIYQGGITITTDRKDVQRYQFLADALTGALINVRACE